MSADLTCSTCKGTGRYSFYGCLICNRTGRRRPELHEWDALVDERDRAKEAVRNLDKALRNAVKERGDALDERDRYREALEQILALAPKIAPGTFEEHGIARRALYSNPDLDRKE